MLLTDSQLCMGGSIFDCYWERFTSILLQVEVLTKFSRRRSFTSYDQNTNSDILIYIKRRIFQIYIGFFVSLLVRLLVWFMLYVDVFFLPNGRLGQFTIDSTSKFHIKISSIFHQLWNVNPCGKNHFDLTWITRRQFDFQNRWNINEFYEDISMSFQCRIGVTSKLAA